MSDDQVVIPPARAARPMIEVEWRAVVAFPAYEVSSTGLIRRVLTRGGNPCCRPLKLWLSEFGYVRAFLTRDGTPYATLVHRLVCEAFNGPAPTPDHEAAHWDGDRANNAPGNLRWATAKENAEDRDRHGRTARAERNGGAKLSAQARRVIRFLFLPKPRSNSAALARRFGVNIMTIREVAGPRPKGRYCRRRHLQTGENVYRMANGKLTCNVCRLRAARQQTARKTALNRSLHGRSKSS